MVTERGGHTLVELLVTFVVLGVGLGAVSAAHLHGARNTDSAGRLQEAAALAVTTLDSLTTADSASAGGSTTGSLAVRWSVRPLGPGLGIDVTVAHVATGRVLAVLRGYGVFSELPVLP